MGYETHHFDAPCGISFKVTLSRSTYSVAAFDRTGRRIAWTGRNWGPSLTDALSMACYTGEPLRASSGLWFLFRRIDYYRDCPGILDLWTAAIYRGEPASVRRERFQPYHEAMRRAHDLRFGGGWSAARDEAERIKAELEAAPPIIWTAERLRQERIGRILREVSNGCRGIGGPIHIDSRNHIARNAVAPMELVDSVIASRLVRKTENARGQPAIELAI